MLIPIAILVDSKIDRRSKISISVVMGLGAIGSVSSILRMVYLKGLLLYGTGLNRTFFFSPPSCIIPTLTDPSQRRQGYNLGDRRARNWHHRRFYRPLTSTDP